MSALCRITLSVLFLGFACMLPGQIQQYTTATPGQFCGLTGIVAVAAGGIGILALRSDGTVWELYGPSAPVQVAELSDVVAVAAGICHHMALKRDGTVWEWPGQWIHPILKPPDLSRDPSQVSKVTDVVAIAAGETRSLAVKRDGTVWEWASLPSADFLRLEIGTPSQVSGLSGVVAVSVAYEAWWDTLLDSRTVALKQDGTVWVWYAGKWGNPSPARISDLSGIVAIAAGPSGDVALKDNGKVWQWDEKLRPVQVSGLSGMVAVAVGSEGAGWAPGPGAYGLALGTDGTVWTWKDPSIWPVQIGGLTDVKAITAAGVYAYTSGIRPVGVAIKGDGTVWGWGETWNAQMCNTTFFPQVAVGGGYLTTVALTNTGSTAISGNLILRDQQGNAFTVGSTNSGSGSSFPISIPPGGTRSLTVNSLNLNDPPKSGWASVETTEGSLSAVEIFQFGGVALTATGVHPSQPMQLAAIPVDDNYSQIRLTAYALANPTNQNLVIKLLLLDQDGKVVDDTVSMTLGPWQQTARYVCRDFNRSAFKGSIVLRAQGGGKFVAVAFVQNQQIFEEIPIIAGNTSN